ncbi:MAG: helix-turn-helix domain-containing protein [Acidobacteriota bacterium]|nr:helix-turn-helix domain-containing protein [Acidobacteriota bacterium]
MRDEPFPWNARPTWLCWSGGKNSAWALKELRDDPRFDVQGLIALVNEKNGRVILHGVRHALLQRQAEAVGLPLRFVPLAPSSSRTERNAALARGFGELRGREATCIAFGDLFSAKGRDRRELVTADTGLEVLFPLWGRDTHVHSTEMLEAGLSAWVCSVDTDSLPADRLGRRYDAVFAASLPVGVDPCGGDDEFHTFVEWAPGWGRRVRVQPTRSIETYNFAFTEMERRGREHGAGADPRVDPFDHFARLDRVRRYVDGHLTEDMDGASVARVAAMTPTGFSRYFREHVGTTFTSWLVRRRVEHACRLLRENSAPARRIAEAVGFHSERTFRRSFHQQMDCSPSEYRKRWLGEPVD